MDRRARQGVRVHWRGQPIAEERLRTWLLDGIEVNVERP
jgi:hypothetical protein